MRNSVAWNRMKVAYTFVITKRNTGFFPAAACPRHNCFTKCLLVLQVRWCFKRKVQERDTVVCLARMQILPLRGRVLLPELSVFGRWRFSEGCREA